MKKTIRKKIMRDLQQAFVIQDVATPNAGGQPDNMMNSMNFDPKKAGNDSKLLDLLRKNENSTAAEIVHSDSGHGTDPTPSPNPDSGTGFEPVLKTNRRFARSAPTSNKYLVSDSSSCGGYESAESEKDQIIVLASEQIRSLDLDQDRRKKTGSPSTAAADPSAKKAKKTFWQKLTGSKKNSSTKTSS
jgi:hypothetical protein